MAMFVSCSVLVVPLLFLAVVVHAGGGGGGGVEVERVCGSLGSYYVTPELCASALCGGDPAPCRAARGAPELAALAVRLAAANATAAKASLEAALAGSAEGANAVAASAGEAEARKGMRSCLQLYAGAVPALQWAARSVAARRYRGAREVLEAAQYIASGCAGMAGEAALPAENDRFSSMVIVAHAVVASMSTA